MEFQASSFGLALVARSGPWSREEEEAERAAEDQLSSPAITQGASKGSPHLHEALPALGTLSPPSIPLEVGQVNFCLKFCLGVHSTGTLRIYSLLS